MDTITSKANIFQRIGKRLRYRRAMKTVEQAERDYIEALEQYSPLKRRWRVRRFVAYNFPGHHVHKNPKGEKVA